MTIAGPARRRMSRGTVAWSIGILIVGIALMSTSVIAPIVPLGVLLGIGVLALAAFRPKAFVLAGMSIIVLTVLIERLAGPIGGHADEAVVAVSVVAFATRRLVTEGRLVALPGSVFLVAFILFGAASSTAHGVGLDIAAESGYIYLKGALYAFALAQLRWNTADFRGLVKYGVGAAAVVALSGLINLVVPSAWAELTTGRPPLHAIGSFPAINGLFQHPAAMSRFCAILAMGAVVYCFVVLRTRLGVVLAVVATGLSVITFEVKSLLGLMAAYGLVALRFARPAGIVAFVCFAPLALIVAGPSVVSLVGDTVNTYVFQESARLRLTTGAFDLANQYFPLGAGFARWASSTAATNYSPEYVVRGFSHIFGLGPVQNQYLNDTQWPAIIGESGWFGAAAFALAIVFAVRSLLKPVGPNESALVRWMRFCGITWAVILVVESVAAPVFVSTPSFPFLFLAVGIVASVRHAHRHDAPVVDAVGTDQATTATDEAVFEQSTVGG